MRKLFIISFLLLTFVSCSSSGDNGNNGGTATDKDVKSDTDAPATKKAYSISIDAKGARSCEILFQWDKNKINSAVFKDSVKGEYGDRGNKFAISFYSVKDADFENEPVSLNIDKSSSTETFTITKSLCYDNKGAAVADPKIVVNGI